MIVRKTLNYLIDSFCYRIRVLLENMVGFSFPIMAVDNIADILAKFGDFESIVVGFCPTGNRSSFEPQTEELPHLYPLSRSSGRRVVRLPELNREQ